MENYYNINAKTFFEETKDLDLSAGRNTFIAKMPEGASILDAGCGSGRDSLFFKKQGYRVMAIDDSIEMVRLASNYIGQEVKLMSFEEVDYVEAFDGIWANASLLHVPKERLVEVLNRFKYALKSRGTLYASFKYGDFSGIRDERYFHDLNEKTAKLYFTEAGYNVCKMWTTQDARPDHSGEVWINLLVQKKY